MLLLWSFSILLCARYVKTTNVTGVNGNNVTLKVYEPNINYITWTYVHNRIASTGPHKPINVTSTYRGKLASDPDGSLIIINLQQEDNGMYSASIKLLNGEMRTAQYQLQVYQNRNRIGGIASVSAFIGSGVIALLFYLYCKRRTPPLISHCSTISRIGVCSSG